MKITTKKEKKILKYETISNCREPKQNVLKHMMTT